MNVDRYADPVETPTACLTLDLEYSFDEGSEAVRYRVFDHLDDYIARFKRRGLPVSIFVVGQTLEDRPEAIRRLDDELDAEFHLHSYSHDMDGAADIEWEIRRGIEAFESILGRRPAGYRAPRCIVTRAELEALSTAGFDFDSSVCPSYRPGVYNHLDAPSEPYYPAACPDLLEMPISVQPQLRVPLSQSYIRLFGEPLMQLLERGSLPDLLVYNSHLHDYYRTDAHDMLSPLRKVMFTRNLDDSTVLFERFLDAVEARGYRFRRLSEVAEEISDPTPIRSVASHH